MINFYAAKTGTDGVHRYVYGWNPTRENNEHHFDPLGYDEMLMTSMRLKIKRLKTHFETF